jgi:hypothetical protein
MWKERIAEGDYIFWIVSAEPDDDELVVTFRVISGARDALGRSLVERFACSGPSVHFLRTMLEACGWQVPRSTVRLNLEKVIGLECAGTVTDDGCGTLVIGAFFPIAELERQRKNALQRMHMAADTEIRQRYLM